MNRFTQKPDSDQPMRTIRVDLSALPLDERVQAIKIFCRILDIDRWDMHDLRDRFLPTDKSDEPAKDREQDDPTVDGGHTPPAAGAGPSRDAEIRASAAAAIAAAATAPLLVIRKRKPAEPSDRPRGPTDSDDRRRE